MTCYGTSYFINQDAAMKYYKDYYISGAMFKSVRQIKGNLALMRRVIERKLAEGEIHIGKPVLKHGQVLSIIHNEGRYAITEETQS